MRKSITHFFDVFLQNHCVLCELSCHDTLICQHCFETLPITHADSKSVLPDYVDHVITLFQYETPISHFIWKLKFRGDLSIANWFSWRWINYLKAVDTLPDLIIPVPLHPMRLKERGFNQALEIAKPIGKYFDIPIDIRSCIKIKNTQPQSSLSGEKRKHNLKNAFGLSYAVSAKHIAILDDVMTTGNTITEIAHLFKKVGVEKIDVWCCARTR